MKRITILLATLALLAGCTVKGGDESSVWKYEQPDWTAEPSDLWRITLLGPNGENPEYSQEFAEYCGCEQDQGRIVHTWTLGIDGGCQWEVKAVRVASGSQGLPAWTLSADIPQGWIVTEVDFPRLAFEVPADTKVIVSAGYGAEYPVSVGGKVVSRYPSVTGGMQLLMAHNSAGTFYYAADDLQGSGKLFAFEGLPGGRMRFSQKVTTSYAWTDTDGHFEIPWSTVFFFNEDTWEHTATDFYRPFTFTTEWGRTLLKDKDITPWIIDADVWLRPKNMFPQVLSALDDAVDFYGPQTGIHWYHWHHHAYDTMYPEYFPPKEGFADKVAQLQEKGTHVTPYTNGRLWDPANESYRKRNGYQASCRKSDGTLYTELYPTSKVPNTVTCPGSSVWQDMLKETTGRLFAEVGSDGIYIDQIGAAASEPCYAEGHLHPKGGGSWWPQAYRKVLDMMRGEGVIPEGKAVTTEENAECYLDLFDMYLIVNTPHSKDIRMVPLFPLVYSDRCVYSGLNYYHEQLNDGHFLYNNARSLLWGAQLGWIQPEWLMKDENRNEIEFLKTLGDFRKAHHDVFVGGRFLREFFPEGDNPLVTVMNDETFPVVMGAEWLNVNGKKVTILVNMSENAHEVRLENGDKLKIEEFSALELTSNL